MNKQQQFWIETYAEEYIRRNRSFDLDSGIKAWSTMLRRTDTITSVLECGCNIGRNIKPLNHFLPSAKKSIIEISPLPFAMVTAEFEFEFAVNHSILDADLPMNYFDLVFTTGVLIHVAPEDLLANMQKIYDLSKRYILFGEIFSREPKSIEYRGDKELLFTRDFGRYFLQHFNCIVLDCGFLWGHWYDAAGFDDCTFWLFEKRSFQGQALNAK